MPEEKSFSEVTQSVQNHANPASSFIIYTKEPYTESSNTRTFTFWPLGVFVFKFFVSSQLTVLRDKSLIKLGERLDGAAIPRARK